MFIVGEGGAVDWHLDYIDVVVLAFGVGLVNCDYNYESSSFDGCSLDWIAPS